MEFSRNVSLNKFLPVMKVGKMRARCNLHIHVHTYAYVYAHREEDENVGFTLIAIKLREINEKICYGTHRLILFYHNFPALFYFYIYLFLSKHLFLFQNIRSF